jgi:hypothetical protein
MDTGRILIFVLFAGIVFAVIIFSSIAAHRRRAELSELAGRLGLDFSPERDEAFATGWGFLKKLNQGSRRYAFNKLAGQYQGYRVFVFDYHYQTGSGKNTQHHHLTCFILVLPDGFPELTIGPEGLLSKLAQAFGYDDIDFESAEFSRAFCVRSPDKKFAYDVCNAQMIEFLLANRDLEIEIQGPALMLAFNGQLSAAKIESNLHRLVEIRLRLPDYLFTKN